ncbi:MAG: Hsp20/alpha crystallin family protein [Candidatus Micrarchaeota archaeon]|nr:Hsp20/alpha crystallin family protein [Candidatus Micrarchaeota archaeon]
MEGFDIWSRMKRMQEEMDRIFSDFFTEPKPSGWLLPAAGSKSLPALHEEMALSRAKADLYETEKEIVAKFDLPGAEKQDINVEIEGGSLKVQVEKKAEKTEKRKGAFIAERSYAGYFRCIPLPPYAKTEEASAEYKNGVLVVRMPKAEAKKEKSKKLQIK